VGRVSSVPTRWMTDQWDRSLRGDGMPLPLTEESHTKVRTLTAPTTPLAKLWHGWGTALKPAWEPITVAQKPLDGTYANNAEKWGVAGLHVDGGRVATCRPAKKRSGRRDRRIGFHMTDGGNVENEALATSRADPPSPASGHRAGRPHDSSSAAPGRRRTWRRGHGVLSIAPRRADPRERPTVPSRTDTRRSSRCR